MRLMKAIPDLENAAITTSRRNAALVMIAPVRCSLAATAGVLSCERSYCSRTRESRKTS